MKDDSIEMKGKVVECLPNTTFKVELETGQIINAYLSGKLRKNRIKVLVEDKVIIQLSPYDLSIGRITWRNKK